MIQRRMEAICSAGMPLQTKQTALLALTREMNGIKERSLILETADFIEDIMNGRNYEGEALERVRQLDKAMALYEANVTDHFNGFYPYERLRIFYSSEGRYADALRVCQAYLALAQNDPARCGAFREWAARYESML